VSDSLSFKYTLTEDDLVRASFAQILVGKRKWLLLAMLTVVLVLLAVSLFQGNWGGVFKLFASVALAGVTILLLKHYVRWTVRKSPYIGVELEMTASPDGLACNSSLGNSQVEWTAYTSVIETAELFLFRSGVVLCAAFPKQSFADPKEMSRFRDLIRARVPDARLLD
jgi:hypothetical protein